jgi:hypothetical protein
MNPLDQAIADVSTSEKSLTDVTTNLTSLQTAAAAAAAPVPAALALVTAGQADYKLKLIALSNVALSVANALPVTPTPAATS